jgi:ethanolaminephosphotransferase
MHLLTYSERKKVLLYEYKGSDQSLLYQYVLSPMALWCVDTFIPEWMAPNVVTTIGLFASILSLVCVLIYNPSLGPNGPIWLHLLHAFTIFFYQTLDNMDGKQARKTKSSSPLGMLFDHGCDAINCCICIIPMASIFGIGWTMSIFVTMWCGFVAFYLQTWEQTYTGAMNLPVINGPSEGLVLAVGMCLASYFYGAIWWSEVL